MNARPRPRPCTALLSLLLGFALAGPLCAQQKIEILPGEPQPAPEVARPGASGRIVRVFDFEEEQTNPGEVPEHWFRAQELPTRPRPGFPAWNRAELRFTSSGGVAASGTGAVRLPTVGGSTSLLLGGGVVPVFQNADYLISAKVLTRGLTHARACLAARFLDAAGKPIPASESRSPLAISNDSWSTVSLELVGAHADAAYIQLELLLLQPRQQFPGRETSPTTIWPQDVQGEAWFDDVTVMQLPRLELRTASPSNIVAAPEQPELQMLVRDLTGETLTARLRVVDIEGRTVDAREHKIGSGFTTETWKPRLRRLGWYRAVMEVTTQNGARVGRTYTDFIWVPSVAEQASSSLAGDPGAAADRVRLGFDVTELPTGLRDMLPEIVRRTGAGAVTLPAWDRSLLPEHAAARAESLEPVIDALIADRCQVGIALAPVPETLAKSLQLEAQDAWTLLSGDSRVWMPYLAQYLERFGPRVTYWQIGPAAADRALWREEFHSEAAAIVQSFSTLAPGPVLGVPGQLGSSWPGQLNGLVPRLVQAVPPDTTSEAVGLAVRSAADFLGAGKGELSLVLEPLPAASYGVSAGAVETAKRAVEFWAACSREGRLLPGASLMLQDPWAWVTLGRRAQLMPRPEAAVWRNLPDRLAGRRVLGTYPAGPGVVCYILAPAARGARGGALVAWNASSTDAVLTGEFGDNLRLVDIYGNVTPISRRPSNGGPRPQVTIPLTSEPVFIEGIDVQLVSFAASFAVEPPFLESSIEQHECEIVLSNPWDVNITGEVRILEPGSFDSEQKDRTWRISPRSLRFSIAPGRTERLPFKVAFSPVEEVGPKPFVVSIDLAADRSYNALEIRRSIEVTVRNIGMDLTATAEGDDLVVEALISNTGSAPLTLEVTAFAEGHPRSKASVTGLAPGNQAVRRFLYPGAAHKLRGHRIVVSGFDPDSRARVNKSVVVP